MSFSATLTIAGQTAVIALQGAMDGKSDAEFLDKIEKASAMDVGELVLDMSSLQQLSAAGCRAVSYARQKMADDVLVVVASPTAAVRATLLDADLDDSVAIRD